MRGKKATPPGTKTERPVCGGPTSTSRRGRRGAMRARGAAPVGGRGVDLMARASPLALPAVATRRVARVAVGAGGGGGDRRALEPPACGAREYCVGHGAMARSRRVVPRALDSSSMHAPPTDDVDWDNLGFSCEHVSKTMMFVANVAPV